MKNEKDVVLKLKQPVTVMPAKVVTELTLQRIVDLPGERVVRAFCDELQNPVVLWSGDGYDKIGDWKQDEANKRLVELVGQ